MKGNVSWDAETPEAKKAKHRGSQVTYGFPQGQLALAHAAKSSGENVSVR